MAAVKGKNTRPEIRVRGLLHQLGFRFRLHAAKLPGRPDIVLPRYRTAIFVHGCFWHRHSGCRRASTPSTRADFWAEKFRRTVERDQRAEAMIREAGWTPIIIWECELADEQQLIERLLTIRG